MVAADAFRVKGHREQKKQDSFARDLSVHPNNRDGVYPGGTRCRELCVNLISSGFVEEEVGHIGVAVEEVPTSELIRSGGQAKKQSASEFKKEKAGKDPLLAGCFGVPGDDGRLSMLSHNHIMLCAARLSHSGAMDIPGAMPRGA